jgi:hypothetical protein
MEPKVKRFLLERGVEIHLSTLIRDVEKEGTRIKAVIGKRGRERIRFEGDVFVDASGTAGPTANCKKYGNGCVTCILRCPSFGGRVSLTAIAGVPEIAGRNGNHIGAMSVA